MVCRRIHRFLLLVLGYAPASLLLVALALMAWVLAEVWAPSSPDAPGVISTTPPLRER